MQQPQPPLSKKKSLIYDRLHRLSIVGILGVSAITTGLLFYNIYLFKKEGVPMLVEKYRSKAEEEIELKQKEAEYIQERKKAEQGFFTDAKFK